jgi:hypothetical protein
VGQTAQLWEKSCRSSGPVVSGLVSEKMGCNENAFQTFDAIEAIVSARRGELRRLEA